MGLPRSSLSLQRSAISSVAFSACACAGNVRAISSGDLRYISLEPWWRSFASSYERPVLMHDR